MLERRVDLPGDQLTLVAWMNILTISSTRDGDCRTAFLSRSSLPRGTHGSAVCSLLFPPVGRGQTHLNQSSRLARSHRRRSSRPSSSSGSLA